jgi:AAA domain
MSGLSRMPGKHVRVNSPPRVRIPPLPPKAPLRGFFFVSFPQLAAPRLLIVDPIVSAVTGDSHKGAEVRRALQPVVALAQCLGCAVLGITHFSTNTAGCDPTERITGSIAFAALARLVLVAAKVKVDEDDAQPRRVLVSAKSNIGPDDGGFSNSLDRVQAALEVGASACAGSKRCKIKPAKCWLRLRLTQKLTTNRLRLKRLWSF